MAKNPSEIVGEKLRGAVVELANRAADSAVTAVSSEIDRRLNPVPARAKAAVDAEFEDEESDDEGEVDMRMHDDETDIDDGFDDDDSAPEELGLNLPLCFAKVGAPAENLELAAAAWRILGRSETDTDEPDIIAVYRDGRAFVGTINQWQDYCERNDVGEDWNLWGVAGQEGDEIQYDTEEIWSIKCSRKALNRVLQDCYNPEALEAARKQYDGFHWHEKGDPVTVITEVPGIQGTLALLGVAENIIYTARKGNEVAKYTHEFGEDAKVKPNLYALGDKVLVIHGGDMVVEDRGIVHN